MVLENIIVVYSRLPPSLRPALFDITHRFCKRQVPCFGLMQLEPNFTVSHRPRDTRYRQEVAENTSGKFVALTDF